MHTKTAKRLICAAAVVLLLAPLPALHAAKLAVPSPPNVMMIIADDLNDWVGCLGGHPDVLTPHIDRLARRGLLFANAHCAAPVCNPSRVATFTGRRPSSSGVYGNDTVWHEVLPGVATIPQHFRANGYFVAGGGKVYHHPPGFNRHSDWSEYFDQVFDSHYQTLWAGGGDIRRFAFPEGFPLNRLPSVQALAKPPQNPNEFDWGPFDKPDDEMADAKMVQWAEQLLRQPPKQPFFLAAGIYRPHLPWYAPRFVDLFPTLNELCGLPSVPSLDGVSLVPLLRDPQRAWDQPALTTHGPGNHALRNERWRYIRYADGREELYDHQDDPHEWINLAGKPEFASLKAGLAKRLPKTDAPNLSPKAKRKKEKATD